MQGIQAGPDQEIQDDEDAELVEAADEAVLRQGPQEQKPEAVGKVTQQPGAQPMPLRRLGSGR